MTKENAPKLIITIDHPKGRDLLSKFTWTTMSTHAFNILTHIESALILMMNKPMIRMYYNIKDNYLHTENLAINKQFE